MNGSPAAPIAIALARSPVSGAAAAMTTATTMDTTVATPAQRSTRLRSVPGSPAPSAIATSRTAATSIPNRAPADATNATWTAIVTSASPPAGSVRPRSTCTPNAAATPASRPTTLAAVPRRRTRSSLTPIVSRAPRRASLEVAEAAQALLDLALLVSCEDAGGGLRRLLVRRGLQAGRRLDHPGEVRERDLRAVGGGGTGAGRHVDALRPVVAGEPVGLLDHPAGVGERVERRRLEQEVGSAIEVGPVEHVLLAADGADRVGARVGVGELEQRCGHLVADTLVVLGGDPAVGLAAAQGDR